MTLTMRILWRQPRLLSSQIVTVRVELTRSRNMKSPEKRKRRRTNLKTVKTDLEVETEAEVEIEQRKRKVPGPHQGLGLGQEVRTGDADILAVREAEAEVLAEGTERDPGVTIREAEEDLGVIVEGIHHHPRAPAEAEADLAITEKLSMKTYWPK